MTFDAATPTLRSGVYEALFVHGRDAVLIGSSEGRVLAANARACELLGRTEQELLELGLAGIVGASDGRWSEVLGIRDRTSAFRGVVQLVRGDRNVFAAEVTTGTFLDGEAS
ncbi:MAG: PAS domain-containing protein, partial [Blastococcus sp.]|nr:PAS domain-containing protein [Blastococcus sp.]